MRQPHPHRGAGEPVTSLRGRRPKGRGLTGDGATGSARRPGLLLLQDRPEQGLQAPARTRPGHGVGIRGRDRDGEGRGRVPGCRADIDPRPGAEHPAGLEDGPADVDESLVGAVLDDDLVGTVQPQLEADVHREVPLGIRGLPFLVHPRPSVLVARSTRRGCSVASGVVEVSANDMPVLPGAGKNWQTWRERFCRRLSRSGRLPPRQPGAIRWPTGQPGMARIGAVVRPFGRSAEVGQYGTIVTWGTFRPIHWRPRSLVAWRTRGGSPSVWRPGTSRRWWTLAGPRARPGRSPGVG